jgi:hypothetical protein
MTHVKKKKNLGREEKAGHNESKDDHVSEMEWFLSRGQAWTSFLVPRESADMKLCAKRRMAKMGS